MQAKPTFFKASGKVLIAGGYAVLEEENVGLSLAVNRHFYSITMSDRHPSSGPTLVRVVSPQIHSKWSYLFDQESNNIRSEEGQQNLFLQNAVKFALIYANQSQVALPKNISLTLLFDRGFLSETQSQLLIKKKFLNYEVGTSKTGMGSSACVVVSVVGGILRSLMHISEYEINAVSHTANIAAQNKIGSNFDISTALFGSQLYTNRIPHLALKASKGRITMVQISKIDPLIKKIKPNKTIKDSRCLAIDLKKGSNTRTMVSGFIKNLKLQPQKQIKQFYSQSKATVLHLFEIMTEQIDREQVLSKLRSLNSSYRKMIQYYSELTKVAVEPPEFKQFLDELNQIEDIGYCICPGSGGYDAIFVLCLAIEEFGWFRARQIIKRCCNNRGLCVEITEMGIQWQCNGISQVQKKEMEDYMGAEKDEF